MKYKVPENLRKEETNFFTGEIFDPLEKYMEHFKNRVSEEAADKFFNMRLETRSFEQIPVIRTEVKKQTIAEWYERAREKGHTID